MATIQIYPDWLQKSLVSSLLGTGTKAMTLPKPVKRCLCIAYAGFALALSTAALADIDQTPRTIDDIRAYGDGSLVIRITPATSASCTYPDTLQLLPSSPDFNLASAIALSAFEAGQKILFIGNGLCTGSNASGNVEITGIMIPAP